MPAPVDILVRNPRGKIDSGRYRMYCALDFNNRAPGIDSKRGNFFVLFQKSWFWMHRVHPLAQPMVNSTRDHVIHHFGREPTGRSRVCTDHATLISLALPHDRAILIHFQRVCALTTISNTTHCMHINIEDIESMLYFLLDGRKKLRLVDHPRSFIRTAHPIRRKFCPLRGIHHMSYRVCR